MKSNITACLLLSALCMTGCSTTDPPPEPLTINTDAAVVSYLGPEGTYTQEACGQFFAHKGSYLPYETVSDAVAALVSGESTYAVIPQENTIGGPVVDYVDTLIGQESISIVGEVELPINQNLLVLPGTDLHTIKTVYSHKQGIAQGKEWLQANLPDAEVIEVASTAEGARMVAEGQDPSCAAIASAACAEVYGLELKAEGIQNHSSNKTRFYVLANDMPSIAPSDRTVFLASGDAEGLPSLMAELQRKNIELVAVHDRPLKTELGSYCYVIECAGCSYQSYTALTEKCPFEFRYLGSFPVC